MQKLTRPKRKLGQSEVGIMLGEHIVDKFPLNEHKRLQHQGWLFIACEIVQVFFILFFFKKKKKQVKYFRVFVPEG
jgi:hypothetical protein